MEVQIYIHGVPNGQNIWSTGGEDPIIKQFYGTESNEQLKYVAEIRKSGNQNYAYYSLLACKDISAENGRAGSYFGLTIRMDAAYKQIQPIFNILYNIYARNILGVFLNKEGKCLRFTVGNFKSKEAECTKVKEGIFNLLTNSLSTNDFVQISPAMIKRGGTPKVNLAECTSESAWATILQYGSIAISADYPTTIMAAYQKQKEEELRNIKDQSIQTINRIQQEAQQKLLSSEKQYNATLQQAKDEAARIQQQAATSHQAELQRVKTDAENRIIQIQQKYSSFEQKNNELNSEKKKLERLLDEKAKETSHLQKEIDHHKKLLAEKIIPQINIGSSNYNTNKSRFNWKQQMPYIMLMVQFFMILLMILLRPADNSQDIKQINDVTTEIKKKIDNDMPEIEKKMSSVITFINQAKNSQVVKKRKPKP